MIKLTVDTNILFDYLYCSREHHKYAKELLRLDSAKLCEIRVVSRFAADVRDGCLRDRLNALLICQRQRIGTIAEWDTSDWDADFWATEEDNDIFNKLFRLIFPKVDPNSKQQPTRVADVGHLLGHMKAERDIFVTRDGPVLEQADALVRDFGISVMGPADAVKHCRQR